MDAIFFLNSWRLFIGFVNFPLLVLFVSPVTFFLFVWLVVFLTGGFLQMLDDPLLSAHFFTLRD